MTCRAIETFRMKVGDGFQSSHTSSVKTFSNPSLKLAQSQTGGGAVIGVAAPRQARAGTTGCRQGAIQQFGNQMPKRRRTGNGGNNVEQVQLTLKLCKQSTSVHMIANMHGGTVTT